jgi:hypothetical protein
MTIVVKAPHPVLNKKALKIFLGGSIDMGTAEKWQDSLANDLSDYDDDLVLINPRRDDWDASWKQDPTPGTQFYQQVDWELTNQENAHGIVYYFAANSKSPITLLELGLFKDHPVIVCCPKEFYRYGNVKMVCERYEIAMVETYEDLVKFLRDAIDEEYAA